MSNLKPGRAKNVIGKANVLAPAPGSGNNPEPRQVNRGKMDHALKDAMASMPSVAKSIGAKK